MTTIPKRPRNEKGQFKESSSYAKNPLAIRLFKDDDEELKNKAKQRGITATEMGRIAIAEWLKNHE